MKKLEIDSVFLELGDRVLLSGIYLHCREGSITGLLGRNGSGKSCLLKIAVGAMAATCKSVRVDGRALPPDYIKAKWISYLPQSGLVPSFLTFSKAAILLKTDVTQLAVHYPEWETISARRPEEVSGGERRWLEMLLLLFATHPFCFLDEPFNGLSPIQIEKLHLVLKEVKATKGIVITDHLYRQVCQVADDLYLLAGGCTYRITEESQLLERGYLPDSAATEVLF